MKSTDRPERDMDSQMLFGCSGFLIAAVGGYGLAIWPFFVIPNLYRLDAFAEAFAVGLAGTAVLTVVCARRFGIAGVFGGIGGAISTGLFLYLRMQQFFLAFQARQSPEPQFPTSMEYLAPLAFLLAVAFTGVAVLPSRK